MALDTTTLTAPAADQSPRDWLAAHGLAKAGTRGRFSKDATEALAFAKDQGWTFVEPVKAAPAAAPAAPRVATTPTPAAAPSEPGVKVVQTHPAGAQASFNAKEVRAWAKANGYEVADRGRVHASVIAAYAKAGGKPTGPTAKRVTPLDMPKRRRETTGFVMIGNTRIRQDICGACRASVSRCDCKVGPSSFPLDGQVYPLSLDLPTL